MPTALKDSNDTAAAAIAAGRDPRGALRERLEHRRAVGPIKPIETKPKAWPALDAKAYHGIVGELVRQIEPHTESDPAAVLLSLLAVAGAVAGRRRWYRIEATRHHPALFVVLVGDTSKSRKGTSWGWARHVARGLDPDFGDTRIVSGLSSGEGLIYNLRDASTQPKKGGKGTVVDPGASDKRLLVHEGEYATVLKQIERQGNTLSPVVRDAWDGMRLGTLTKNSPLRASDPHVAIVAHVTEAELRKRLTETESANGFANRFLFGCVRRSKVLPFGGNLEAEALEDPISRLRRNIGKHGGEVWMDEGARDLWAAGYERLSAGRPGMVGALTARSEAQALRLALVYATCAGAPRIERAHVEAALAVVDFCERSADHVFGDLTGDSVADTVLHALRESPGGLSRSEIFRLFGNNRGAGELDAALLNLTDGGLIRAERDTATGGAPKTTWHATEGGKL